MFMIQPQLKPRPLSRYAGWVAGGLCGLLAAAAHADTKLITTGSPARVLVPASDALGGTWRSVSFNDSAWTAAQNGVGYEVQPGAYSASVIADSRGDWSTSGQQGENRWINGYYDKTADADGVYQAVDFQPFPRANGPWDDDNFWDGGSWNWFPDNVPWDTIGQTFVHPNGENSGGVEHWVIRRWHSTAAGAITIRFHLRKDNTSGTGVSGKVFKNGEEIFSRAIPGTDTTGFEVYLPVAATPTDVFDFALTPVGAGGDASDGSDGSVMIATILSGTVTPPPPPVQPTAIADSSADWVPDVQGANGWFYGFYNYTADADHVYDPNADFNNTDPNWTSQGGSWQLGEAGNPGANPPWDTIGQTDWHPNGDNQPQGVHWMIRRWVSDADGDLHARVQFKKSNTGGGNGTTLHVLHNGTDVFSKTIAGNDGTGIDQFVALPGVLVGDKIEFALDPKGTDGLLGDGADGSFLIATIRTGPVPQSELANSASDWATGAQGEGGWFYGFYNETADADHVYDANADFNNTDPDWSLQGGSWQLGEPGNPGANPPWDTIGQTDWHPNGDNQPQGVHWMIRRWVAEADGDMYTHVQFGKANTGGGNGTTLRILLNGTQVFSATVAFNNGNGIDTNVSLPGVLIGDKIDFALDPLGTDGGKGDGADGSFLRASILAGQPPEPPRPFVPGIADCIQTDIRSAMRGVNPSVYIRYPFTVDNPASIETLKLKMKYNDGFAAYLNGKEILKRNAPTAISGSVVADSKADWSTNPDVTVNGWSYGFYDQTLDTDQAYSGGSDMTLFPHDGLGYSATDYWNGSGYDWFQGNPPWTELFQEGTHPNHPNGGAQDPGNPATHLQWTVRRWTATVDAGLKCRIRFWKTNPNCGDGVRLAVFHNSTQVYSQTIAFNDAVGRDDTIELPDVFLGDTVDFLLGPGDGNDYCDGSAVNVTIFEGEPAIPWNGAATAARTTTDTITAETFDLTSFLGDLNAGANVLAIQGFNRDVNDNEFVINAQLLANRVPVAAPDTLAAAADTTTTYPSSALLGNDSDPDGDAILLVGVTPSHQTARGGTVRLYGSTVVYTPPAGFSGADTFEYTATDGSGTPARAQVTVNVAGAPANNPPSFSLSGASVTENSAAPRTVSGWALNISPGPGAFESGQTVTFQVGNDHPELFAVQPAISPAGVLTFTAKPGSSGTVHVSVVAKDDGGTDRGGVDTSAAQSFTIELNVPGECPAAQAQSITIAAGGSKAIVLAASHAAGAAFSIGTGPAHGTLSGTPPSVTYTPTAGYCGSDSFTFNVDLAGCPRSSATVAISVDCGNTCPIAVANVGPGVDVFLCGAETVIIAGDYSGLGGTCTDGTARVELDGTDSRDADGGVLTYSWFLVQENGAVVPLASGARAFTTLEPGMYTIRLVVDDGRCQDSMEVDIHVITPAEGIAALIDDVNTGSLGSRNRRPLISLLKSASACYDRCLCESGVKQLNAFINKVRAQLEPSRPETAADLIAKAQALLDATNCGQP